MEVVPRLPKLYDEPFADSSQIPTFIVSELARRAVTVTLSGDGGDELFGGYNRYSWSLPLWEKIGRMPPTLRRGTGALLGALSPEAWDALFRRVGPALPSRLRVRNPGMKIQKVASILPSEGLEDMYLRLASHWRHPAALVRGGDEPMSAVTDRGSWPRLEDPVARMMYLDLITYLPDDILVKVDRATMAVSLEARVPMLDHRLVEFAWKVPLAMKLREGQGKWLLRQVLYRHVPRELMERPKMGFGLPVGEWLRGPLRDWAESLLDRSRLRREGYLDSTAVHAIWDIHLSGRRNMQDQLWDVLMFQSWLEENARSLSGARTC
jgi:asparagine synthase (glutamine-hydrolysing)